MSKNSLMQVNKPICLAIILFCLTVFSLSFTGQLYARYRVADASSDTARVAVWKVDATDTKSNMSINCGTYDLNDEYGFTVKNQSEVDVKYDVVVQFSSSLDDGVSLKLDGTRTPTKIDSKTFIFSNVGRLESGTTSSDHIITFTANTDLIDENLFYSFSVLVDFEQVD